MKDRYTLKKTGVKRYTIDVSGGVCPFPQLLTLRALSQLGSGDILEVKLDNPPSVKDIPPALEKKGYKVSEVSSVDKGIWKIIIQL